MALTLLDPTQTSKVWQYRRPVLQFGSITTVAVEAGLNGTSGDITVLFADGKVLSVNSTTQTTFDITRNCVLSGTKQSGLRASLSESINQWYALYAVRATDNDNTWVTVGDTLFPTQANYSNINTNFGGLGKWCYLGPIRNGDNAGATGDILNFGMSGNFITFINATNATATTIAGTGLRLATTASATTLTYTYSSGTGATNIPPTIGNATFQCCWGTVTGKQVFNAAGTSMLSMAGAASAVGQTLVTTAATNGIQLQNGPGGPIAYTIQLYGIWDNALGIGTNPLL